MAPYKNECGEKNLNQTAQDKKMRLIKMTVANKNRSKSVAKKWHLIQMTVPKKILNQTAQDQKNVPYKNVCCQKKIGAKQLTIKIGTL